MNVIVIYVPTLVRIEACLKDRDDFYEALEEAIRFHEKNQHMVMATDHFNAKAGSAYPQYKDEIEKY